jgi:hypothetical protein
MVASINVGCRVTGSHGPFLPAMCNPDGTQVKRRKWQQREGVIVEAQGEKKWLVRFDTGIEKECPSLGLKLLFDPSYRSGAAAVTRLPSSSAVAPSISLQEPSSSAAAPPIAPQAPLLSAAAPSIAPQGPSSSAVVATIAPQEPSSSVVPRIAPHAPLLSEAAQPNDSSAAAEITQDESVEPEDVDVGDMDEEIHEGIQEEDVGFDVVENILSLSKALIM